MTRSRTLLSGVAITALSLSQIAAPAFAQEAQAPAADAGQTAPADATGAASPDNAEAAPTGDAGAMSSDNAEAAPTGDAGAMSSDNAEAAPTGDAGAAPQADAQAGSQSPAGDQTAPGRVLEPEMLIASVGETEIRGADILRFLASLPPQMRNQAPEMLLSLAIQQLVLRAMIIEEARAAGLADDPEVKKLVESEGPEAEDDAMVQTWLTREFENRIGDEDVQAAYDEAKANAGADQELPPIDQVRPQIEQMLRQQAINTIRQELQQGADITFYDAQGNPVKPDTAGAAGAAGGGLTPPEAPDEANAPQADNAATMDDDAASSEAMDDEAVIDSEADAAGEADPAENSGN